ncbi:hypothetical protein [Kamptonema formosum]|uniref:hypothetical protein n=1 Tax=Kamptonema formosum TaxID=331992 RepID=UPI00034774DE|nr:hypothetical protein [Oscillatoria sp. PCC 10802]
MPADKFDSFPNPPRLEPEWPDSLEIEQWIAALKQSQEMNYKMMSLNAWVLSETMDRFVPGFWSRFMANRQIAHKQFLQRMQKRHKPAGAPSDSPHAGGTGQGLAEGETTGSSSH